MASWLADFWSRLATQLLDVPDHFFLEQVIQFSLGPLRLELLNAGSGMGGIPRDFVLALANAMVGYTERGFCGIFNARISNMGVGVGGARAEVKLWISFRIV